MLLVSARGALPFVLGVAMPLHCTRRYDDLLRFQHVRQEWLEALRKKSLRRLQLLREAFGGAWSRIAAGSKSKSSAESLYVL